MLDRVMCSFYGDAFYIRIINKEAYKGRYINEMEIN